jgi:hypothetical protein
MACYSARKHSARNPITGEEVDYKQNISNTLFGTKQQQLYVEPVQKTNNNPETDHVGRLNKIPLLNFGDLLSDRNVDKKPVLNNNERIQNSARPKSSYRRGYDQGPLESPIMHYQTAMQLQAKTCQQPAVTTSELSHKSQLDAPRFEKAEQIQKPQTFKVDRLDDLQLVLANPSGSASNTIDQSQPAIGTPIGQDQDKNRSLKENLVLDALMTDQLSRFVLSEPEQEQRHEQPIRKMHNTVVRPRTTENILSKRIKFNCRLRTSDGKNALRELFGFLFLHDGSLTIYEFRQFCGSQFSGIGSGNFSKKANALPFLPRKTYTHSGGRRAGKKIDVEDIFVGSTLYIVDGVDVEITDVDQNEKEKLIVDGEMSEPVLADLRRKINLNFTDIEVVDQKKILSVQMHMRAQLKNRAIKVYSNLGNDLRRLSAKTAGSMLDRSQFHTALNQYKLQIHDDDLDIVWQVLDLNNTGCVNYYRLIRAFLGEMNQYKHGVFRELMHKLDTQKSGHFHVTDVYKFFKAKSHPFVRSGQIDENEVFEQFLSAFEFIKPNTMKTYATFQANSNTLLIDYEQFENFYNGLSLIVNSDKDFVCILKNSWSLF